MNTGIQDTVQNKSIFICLDVLNTGIQNTVQNIPEFDPEMQTELTLKDECEDLISGYLKS